MENSIQPNDLISVIPDQVSCDLANETVILALKEGVYYGLNEVGTRIWQLIQSPISLIQIRDTLLQEYNVEPEVCEQEILRLLDNLAQHQLIKIQHESAD